MNGTNFLIWEYLAGGRNMFYEREFGNVEIILDEQLDSAYKVRFLLPAISYLDNCHHEDAARLGHVRLYRGLKLQFWRWLVTVKKYHAAYNNRLT